MTMFSWSGAEFFILRARNFGSMKHVLWCICEPTAVRFVLFCPCSLLLISCPPTGLEDYMKRYGEGIRRILTSFGPVPDLSSGEGAKSIVNVSMDDTFTETSQKPTVCKMSQFSFVLIKGILIKTDINKQMFIYGVFSSACPKVKKFLHTPAPNCSLLVGIT